MYFTVPENQAAVEKPTKKCSWCIPAAVAAAVLVVAGITVWLLIPGKIVVPKLTGMTYGDAVVKIATSKLKFEDDKNRKVKQDNANINKVITQKPAAETEVEEGTAITLVIGIAKVKKGTKPKKIIPVLTKAQIRIINATSNIKVNRYIPKKINGSILYKTKSSKNKNINIRTQPK